MKLFSLVVFLVLLGGCTSFPAAILPEVIDGVPNKIALSESKQLYLSQVKTRLEKTSVGQMKIGNACVNEKEFKWANNDIFNGIFRDSMINEFFKYNYNIPQNTLEIKNQEDAEVLLGARMIDMKANICSAINGVKGDAVVKIEWTVFDKISDKITIIETYGRGNVPSLIPGGSKELYRNAAADAARNLMASDQFFEIIKK